MRIIGKNFFLPDLHLGQRCVFLDEIDTQVELTPLCATFKHVVNSGDDVAGLQVAAAQAETGRVKIGNLLGLECRQACREAAVLLARLSVGSGARPFSTACAMAERISRIIGNSTASG